MAMSMEAVGAAPWRIIGTGFGMNDPGAVISGNPADQSGGGIRPGSAEVVKGAYFIRHRLNSTYKSRLYALFFNKYPLYL